MDSQDRPERATANSSISFEGGAIEFVADDDLNVEVLVIAEHLDGSGRRLEIQRSLVAAEQDRRLGQGTYCVVNENQVTVYGGVASWSSDGAELRIALTPEAGEMFGAPAYRIRITDPRDLSDVRHRLDALFEP